MPAIGGRIKLEFYEFDKTPSWLYNIPTAIEHELLAVDHEKQVTVGLAHVDSWKSHDTRYTSPLSV